MAGRRAHKIFPPLWITTKKPPIFTVPSWPWPKDWPWPKPGGPWPGPWCLSCPKPGMLDKLKDRINPVEIKGGLDKIRQTIGVAGRVLIYKERLL